MKQRKQRLRLRKRRRSHSGEVNITSLDLTYFSEGRDVHSSALEKQSFQTVSMNVKKPCGRKINEILKGHHAPF